MSFDLVDAVTRVPTFEQWITDREQAMERVLSKAGLSRDDSRIDDMANAIIASATTATAPKLKIGSDPVLQEQSVKSMLRIVQAQLHLVAELRGTTVDDIFGVWVAAANKMLR